MNDDRASGVKASTEMAPDYGAKGLFGVLTPQANTTVEPELWSLLPPGWSMLNARLTSTADTIEARLLDYTSKYQGTAAQFANAPIAALAIACTGTSYLLDRVREKAIIESISQRLQIPCITAADATLLMLQTIGVRKIALLSPYPESLNDASSRYWQSRGFDIVKKIGPQPSGDTFHPIYSMSGKAVFDAYLRLADSDAELVLMLGTGMPTLGPILEGAERNIKPALSCNLALAWAVVNAASGTTLSVGEWLSGRGWRRRFRSVAG